jgi:hypothetical protein
MTPASPISERKTSGDSDEINPSIPISRKKSKVKQHVKGIEFTKIKMKREKPIKKRRDMKQHLED